ncbi:MAG: hypothetical protein M3Z36_15250 [Acidobacteriota bacterium]|nr:hypothetical protein [Acidobacteriota bacterium]
MQLALPRGDFPPLLFLSVVLLFVNILADFVLLTIDLLPLGSGQFPAMILTIIPNLAIDLALFLFETYRFRRGQLTGLDAVADPLLLIDAPIVNGGLFLRNGRRGLRGVLRKNSGERDGGKYGSAQKCFHYCFSLIF